MVCISFWTKVIFFGIHKLRHKIPTYNSHKMTFYKTKTMIKDDMKLYLSLSSPLETEIRSLSPHLAWMIPTVLPMNSVAIFYEFHIRTCNLIRSGCADNR